LVCSAPPEQQRYPAEADLLTAPITVFTIPMRPKPDCKVGRETYRAYKKNGCGGFGTRWKQTETADSPLTNNRESFCRIPLARYQAEHSRLAEIGTRQSSPLNSPHLPDALGIYVGEPTI